MIENKFLLDTNIVIAWFRTEEAIANKIADAAQIFIPSIVIGELYYGAMKSQRIKKNVTSINDLSNQYPVISVNGKTAQEYGIIKANLKKEGKLIPDNDTWIAALAKQYDLPLVTRDAHFDAVDDIIKIAW